VAHALQLFTVYRTGSGNTTVKTTFFKESPMNARTTKTLLKGTSAICLLLLIVGCINNPQERNAGVDASSFAAQEVADMGGIAGALVGQGLSKSSSAADTFRIDIQRFPFSYDSNTGAFFRERSLITSEGYQAVRRDTVIFRGASGETIARPAFQTVATIRHIRHTTRANGDHGTDVRLEVDGVLSAEGADFVLVKNGALTGTCDAEPFRSGAIEGVTRRFSDGAWHFPESGRIWLDFPGRTCEVLYTGDGGATATVTEKATGDVSVVTLQINVN